MLQFFHNPNLLPPHEVIEPHKRHAEHTSFCCQPVGIPDMLPFKDHFPNINSSSFPNISACVARLCSILALPHFFPFVSAANAFIVSRYASSTGDNVFSCHLRYSSVALSTACWWLTDPAFSSSFCPDDDRIESS